MRKMKKIRIFVASSIVSFNSERKRMGAFFCAWNNRLIDKSVFLDVKFCEELDNAVPERRKQDEYNSYIEKSDLFIMLTDSECGSYTAEEFDVAWRSKKRPELLVFCRELAASLSDNVNRMKSLAESRGEFIRYSDYKDQVELYLLSYIQRFIDRQDIRGEVHGDHLKRITFFFGASDIQYEDERDEILRFVLGLNERMLEKGIYIQAEPDDAVDALNQTALAEKHKSLINESETAFFLFFFKVDELLEKDFRYAIRQFHEKSYPRIFTYFFNRTPVYDDGILRLKKYIDCEMNHYYSEFSNVDSVKLSILIQLSDKYIQGFRISVEDGVISDGNQQGLLDVSDLSMFSENDTLVRLKREQETLTQQYDEAAAEFAGDYRRRDLIEKLSNLDDAIRVLTGKIHKEENAALTMLIEMHRSISKGETKQLVKKAYRYLEAGRVKEASKILNKETVDTIYGECLNSQIAHVQEEIADAVQMYRHTIHIQKMLEESEESINTIISCYEEIMKYLDFLNDADIDIVLDYAEYLDDLGREAAEKIFKKAEYLAGSPEREIAKTTWARLYALTGTYYLKQYNSSMAEKYLKFYLDTMEELYHSDNVTYVLEYAAASLKYCRISTKEKSLYMERGLSALLKISDEKAESAEYNLALAKYYYERGNFYQKYDSKKELESYTKAKVILEKKDISDQLLADVYNNLAEAIKANDADRVSEAVVSRYYDLAIRILEKGYSTAPDKYAEALGDLYSNKAVFYTYYGENYYQTAQTLKECEKVYLYLYKKNPVRGGLGLAECYIQMANTYESLGNSKRAITYSEKGISLLEELAEINRERYAIKLAWAYNETGQMYLLLNEKKKVSGFTTAIEYWCKCLDTLENTGNEFIQHKQVYFVVEMLSAILPILKNRKEDTEDIYTVLDRFYRFAYKYIWPDLKTQSGFVNIMFEMGCKLVEYYNPKNYEDTKAFYYPAMREICEQRLADEMLAPDDRIYTNYYMAMLGGLMGDVEKGQEYLDQSIFAFLESDGAKKRKKRKK